MASFKQGSAHDLLNALMGYLAFPTPGAARTLHTLLTQRREIFLNPLSKKVCEREPNRRQEDSIGAIVLLGGIATKDTRFSAQARRKLEHLTDPVVVHVSYYPI